VRRWLSTSSPVKKQQIKPVQEKKQALLKENNPSSLKSLVLKSLDPFVDPVEQSEYKRYIFQFSNKSIQDYTKEEKNHPDLKIFSNYADCSFENIINYDRDVKAFYNAFILSGTTEAFVGISLRSNDNLRAEGYTNYLETGQYLHLNKRKV
jgi:hypothetical protein